MFVKDKLVIQLDVRVIPYYCFQSRVCIFLLFYGHPRSENFMEVLILQIVLISFLFKSHSKIRLPPWGLTNWLNNNLFQLKDLISENMKIYQIRSNLLAKVGVFNSIFSKIRARSPTVFIILLNSALTFLRYM